MKDTRQVLLGILAALTSVILLLGSLSLALTEGGIRLAFLPSATATLPPSPTTLPVGSVSPTLSPTPGPSPSATTTPTITLTPIPLPTSACSYPPGWLPYTVQPGDTLDLLASIYDVTVAELMAGNCLQTSLLIPGTVIYVPRLSPTDTPHVVCGPPPGWVTYIVQWGDTLSALSRLFGVTVQQLMNANCLQDSRIYAGQRLWVPFVLPRTATPTSTHTSTPVPTSTTSVPTPVTPTNTPTPTLVPPPTFTSTPLPTATDTSVPPTNTAVPPTPTDTPLPTFTPTATVAPPTPTATNTSIPTGAPQPPNPHGEHHIHPKSAAWIKGAGTPLTIEAWVGMK